MNNFSGIVVSQKKPLNAWAVYGINKCKKKKHWVRQGHGWLRIQIGEKWQDSEYVKRCG